MDNNPPVQTQSNGGITPSFNLFKPSIEAIKLNLKTVLVISLVLPVYFMLVGVISGFMITTNGKFLSGGIAIAIVTFVIGLALSLIFAPATIYLQLQSVKGKQVDFNEVFANGRKYIWRFFALSTLVGLTVLCGLLFFIVPGVIFMRRYFLAGYYMIDQDLGIIEAMKASALQSKQFSGSIYGIIGVYIVLAIAAGFLGIIPIFGTIAGLLIQFIYSFAPAVRYTEIQTVTSNTAPPAATAAPTQPVAAAS